ncbi:MAG: hypothetical protein EBS48_08320 [Actinobacteria bacterium]|nr:hypothetical protein [Actinomycetota bacterium]
MKSAKSTPSTYTQYIVRKYNGTYLNQRTFTGRTPHMWGPICEAHVFSSPAEAQSCASNINRRPHARTNADAARAEVVPVEIIRRS